MSNKFNVCDRSEYDPNDDTVYLLHGWTSDGTQWPEDAKDEFLKSSVSIICL